MLACPFGVPKMHSDFDLMMKCDLCYDRTSVGRRPMCATVCPSGALFFGTAEEVRDQRAVTLAQAYARHPERFGRRPRPPEIPQTAWINDPAKRGEPAPQTS